MLEMEEGDDDTKAKIRLLKSKIKKHNAAHPMESFYSRDTQGKKRKRPNGDVENRGADGGATNSAELGARDYELEPEEIVDEKGGVWTTLSNVR